MALLTRSERGEAASLPVAMLNFLFCLEGYSPRDLASELCRRL